LVKTEYVLEIQVEVANGNRSLQRVIWGRATVGIGDRRPKGRVRVKEFIHLSEPQFLHL
jgi:hypothetical protein